MQKFEVRLIIFICSLCTTKNAINLMVYQQIELIIVIIKKKRQLADCNGVMVLIDTYVTIVLLSYALHFRHPQLYKPRIRDERRFSSVN